MPGRQRTAQGNGEVVNLTGATANDVPGLDSNALICLADFLKALNDQRRENGVHVTPYNAFNVVTRGGVTVSVQFIPEAEGLAGEYKVVSW